MLYHTKLLALSVCITSSIALPTPHIAPSSVPKVSATSLLSDSAHSALAKQPTQGDDPMSALMARRMAMREQVVDGQETHQDETSELSSAELMKGAVEVAKLTIGTIKDAVTGLVQQVDTVNEEIKDLNATQMLGIDPATVAKFTSNAAYASIHLSHVTTDAHTIYKSMLDLTDVTIQTLQMGKKAGASDATKVSTVKSAMRLFAATAQSSTQQLEALQTNVGRMQEEYAYVKTASNSIAITLRDSLSGKDDWMKEHEKSLRLEAFSACGATCVCVTPGCCSNCYAAAIPIVESKIAAMKNDMESAQNQVNVLAGRFDSITNATADIHAMAKDDCRKMGLVATELSDRANQIDSKVVRTPPGSTFWDIVLPPLESLQGDLQKAADTGRAPPAPA